MIAGAEGAGKGEMVNCILEWLDARGIETHAMSQPKRFELRKQTGFKRYKLTDEDWRNREKSPAYEAAACDMIAECSTSYAPWTLVEACNKRFARVKVLRTICERIERALGLAPGKNQQSQSG